MWLSAAKLGLAIAALNGPQQLSADEQSLFRQISSQMIFVVQNGQPNGAGSLIDDRGLFLIHKNFAYSAVLSGRMLDGQTFELRLVSTDEPTQLALVQAPMWATRKQEAARATNSAPGAPSVAKVKAQNPEGPVLAVLPNGTPMRAELKSSNRIGLVNPARRVMTLTEFQFEAPPQTIGGSLVFNMEGKLVGILGAALEAPAQNTQGRGFDQTFGGGGGGTNSFIAQKTVGPGPMTVAYSVGPEILSRVIEGFLSPSHTVDHPALGILCKDAPRDGGALVDTVLQGSPAEKGGLRAGDIIVELDGKPIASQIDYAKFMLKQRVGNTLRAKIKRGPLDLTLSLTVGK